MKKHTSIFKLTMLVILGFFMASPVFAVSQVPRNRTVTDIYTYANIAVIRFTPSFTNTENCNGSIEHSAAIIDWSGNKDIKVMLAAAMSAKLLGLEIGIGLSGCFNNFAGGTPKAYRIDLR